MRAVLLVRAFRPVLNFEFFDAGEGAVIRDQGCAGGESVGGDHGVEVSHGAAIAFECGAEVAIVLGGLGIPRQDRHAQEEILE